MSLVSEELAREHARRAGLEATATFVRLEAEEQPVRLVGILLQLDADSAPYDWDAMAPVEAFRCGSCDGLHVRYRQDASADWIMLEPPK